MVILIIYKHCRLPWKGELHWSRRIQTSNSNGKIDFEYQNRNVDSTKWFVYFLTDFANHALRKECISRNFILEMQIFISLIAIVTQLFVVKLLISYFNQCLKNTR